MADQTYSPAAIATRRRSLGRMLDGVAAKLEGSVIDLSHMLEKDFMSDKEIAVIVRQQEALEVVARNVAKIGKRLDK